MSYPHFRLIRISGVRNAMSYSPPGGQWPSYPPYQQPYPSYPSYPSYPNYPPYQQPYPYQAQPYPPYQQYQPEPEAQLDEGPLPEMPQGFTPGRYASIFAVALGIICLVALVLAALAPALTPRTATTVPSDWGKVYDGVIRADGVWDTADVCSAVSGGLDIHADNSSSNVSCDFKPSESVDVLSQGFYIQAQVAPSARVAGVQLPMITVGQGEDISVAFDQEGKYGLCSGTGAVCQTDSTVAWHSDSFVPNTIGLLYVPDGPASASGTLTTFANGQAIARVPATLPPNSPLALGAEKGGEALFTHVTLYLASAH